MSRRLVVSDGTRDREMQLVGRVVVGRDPTCDFSYDHTLLSRRHAEFVTVADHVTVRDLGSRNGVFVNGVRVAEQRLRPGDVVQIGPIRARYVMDAAPASIMPEQLDADRTAMLAAPSPVVASVLTPPGPAHRPAMENDDDAITRLMEAPSIPSPAPVPMTDSDDEGTRFIAAPVQVRAASAAVAVPPVETAVRVPGPVTAPDHATSGLARFVSLQVLALAGVIVAAAALSPVIWSAAFSGGGSTGIATLGSLAILAVIAAVAAWSTGRAINKRVAHALAARRDRT